MPLRSHSSVIAPAVGADFLNRLAVVDNFTSIWKMDEASGNAVDTQGVQDAVVSAGVARSIASIIPNKPSDDCMEFDNSADTIIAAHNAAYSNMWSSDVILLFTSRLTSNANFFQFIGKFGGATGGRAQYRDTAISFPRTIQFFLRYTGGDFSLFSNSDALPLNTASLVEIHFNSATPANSRIYVAGSDVTDTGSTSTPSGSVQSDNSIGIGIFTNTAGTSTYLGRGQYAAIKLGTGDAAGALARFNDWNTPG